MGFDDIEGKGDKYVVIVEWNTVAIGLLWVFTWYLEWDDYYLCLIPPNKPISNQIEGHREVMLNNESSQAGKTIYYEANDE